MLIRNATLADGRHCDVRVDGERIAAVGEGLSGADEREIDATGKRLLPGMIDAHVHFREPGAPHKETWTSGSRSAAAGGVTTVVDQPNTDPPTIDGDTFERKEAFADASLVDYGLNGGVVPGWDPDSLLAQPVFALGELFLADSTGEMGIDERRFRDALAAAERHDVRVTVHAEDATRFNPSAKERTDADAWSAYRAARAETAAVERVVEIAAEYDVDLHIAHASTPEAIDTAGSAGISTEVTPHHLFLSRSNSDDLGTLGRMNPPLRREKRRERVYDRVRDGRVDIVATDHAPHTREEKDASIWDAPSGVPGVETALALLLEEARRGHLSYERVRDLTAANPAALFDLPNKGRIAEGYDADLVLIDPTETREIRADDLHTACDWTPFEGWRGLFPELTMVRGTVVYERTDEGERFHEHEGRNVRLARSGPVADELSGAPADGTAEDEGDVGENEQANGNSGADSVDGGHSTDVGGQSTPHEQAGDSTDDESADGESETTSEQDDQPETDQEETANAVPDEEATDHEPAVVAPDPGTTEETDDD